MQNQSDYDYQPYEELQTYGTQVTQLDKYKLGTQDLIAISIIGTVLQRYMNFGQNFAFIKRSKGSLFLLILIWWAFISICNSRCPWSTVQEGLPSNNRIAPTELKEHSDSPPDYDAVLGSV